jgi:flagellar biosynthesis/type III secretory pathway ATPase
MVTALLNTDLLVRVEKSDLATHLATLGKIVDGDGKTLDKSKKFNAVLKRYREISAKQTTDVSRRESREKMFVEMVNIIAEESL